jgi:hypothetical protein
VKWEVVSTTTETNGAVPVISKKVVGHVGNSADPAIKVDIQLTLSTPANATVPVPVMMEFGENPEFLAAMAARRAAAGQPPMPTPPGPTWQQQVLAKGWDTRPLFPPAFRRTMAQD